MGSGLTGELQEYCGTIHRSYSGGVTGRLWHCTQELQWGSYRNTVALYTGVTVGSYRNTVALYTGVTVGELQTVCIVGEIVHRC